MNDRSRAAAMLFGQVFGGVGGIWCLWTTWIAWRGGRVPLVGIELEGGLLGALFWLFVVSPIFETAWTISGAVVGFTLERTLTHAARALRPGSVGRRIIAIVGLIVGVAGAVPVFLSLRTRPQAELPVAAPDISVEPVAKGRPSDEKLARLTRRIRETPLDQRAWASRGFQYLDRLEPAKALADLDRAIELDPSDAGSLSNRGIARAMLGDFDSSLRDFERAIELKPTPETFNSRGVTYLNIGDYQKALRDFDIALRDRPRWADALYNRGRALLLLSEYGQAITSASESIAADPKFDAAYYVRALARLQLGDEGGASQDLDTSIQLGVVLPEAYFVRGTLREKRGRTSEAKLDFATACDRGHQEACTRVVGSPPGGVR